MPKIIKQPPLIIETPSDEINLPHFLTYVELKNNQQLMLVVDCLAGNVLYAYDYEKMTFNQRKAFENFDYSKDLFVHEMLCEAGLIEKMGDKLKCIPTGLINRYVGRVVYPAK